MASKIPGIVKLIEHRMKAGAYALQRLPSERALAAELGVSYMTARRAIQKLRADGLWDGGAGDWAAPSKQLQIAFLAPAFDSAVANAWHLALSRAVQKKHGIVRPVAYVDWSDPVITDTLEAPLDGIFMIPPPMLKLPRVLSDLMRRHRSRIVTFFSDYTDLGIPCVDMGAPLYIHGLAKHLAELGHRKVGCINTQPMAPVIEQRIKAWEAAVAKEGLEGPTYNEPVEPFGDAAMGSYELGLRLMDDGRFQECTAYFCTLTLSAGGIIRAAYERGIKIGKDVSLCSCDTPEAARLLTPSLTTLKLPDRSGLCERALKWITDGPDRWRGPMYIIPEDTAVLPGESTGPCPRP